MSREFMLTAQRDRYRLLQEHAPKGSSCFIAAKTTADLSQEALDLQKELKREMKNRPDLLELPLSK